MVKRVVKLIIDSNPVDDCRTARFEFVESVRLGYGHTLTVLFMQSSSLSLDSI